MQAELEAWWYKIQREGLSESNFEKYTGISIVHGRIETRTFHQLLVEKSWLAKAYQWTRLKNIIKINAQVYDKKQVKIRGEPVGLSAL
jgi:hypothetical protein